MLYETQTSQWKPLAITSAANPVWSNDSEVLYVHAHQAGNRPILRLSIPDGKIEEVLNLSDFHVGNITHDDFAGITLDDVPLMHAEFSSGNLCSMNLLQR
jgi:hypothetical protein